MSGQIMLTVLIFLRNVAEKKYANLDKLKAGVVFKVTLLSQRFLTCLGLPECCVHILTNMLRQVSQIFMLMAWWCLNQLISVKFRGCYYCGDKKFNAYQKKGVHSQLTNNFGGLY